jgi:hypothetical protein
VSTACFFGEWLQSFFEAIAPGLEENEPLLEIVYVSDREPSDFVFI